MQVRGRDEEFQWHVTGDQSIVSSRVGEHRAFTVGFDDHDARACGRFGIARDPGRHSGVAKIVDRGIAPGIRAHAGDHRY